MAIISGSGFETLLDGTEQSRIGTTQVCYSIICFVSNMAARIEQRLTIREVVEAAKEKKPIIQQILKEKIKHLPKKRRCSYARALKDAKFQDNYPSQ